MFTAEHDRLDSVRITGRPRRDLRALLRELHRLESHVSERRLAVLAELDALTDGGVDAAAEARSATHRSARAAEKDARTADALAHMPTAAESLASGTITVEHAERLAVLAAHTSSTEASELLPLAEQTPADLFRKKSNRWLSSRRSAKEIEQQHQRQRAERELSVWFEGSDEENGALLIHGRMDNATGRAFVSALQAQVDKLWRDDGGRDGTPSEMRTPAQRRIDALSDLVRSPAGESEQGVSVRNLMHIIVNAESDEAEFLDGQPVPPTFLADLDPWRTDVVGHVYSGRGKPLWTGRRHRLATVNQWPVLIARDRGCTDCGADPSFTQAHHCEVEWEDGGPTDIDNLELKCHTDHGLAHRRSEAA